MRIPLCLSLPSPARRRLRQHACAVVKLGPAVKASDTTASRAADAALSMLGKPYKYGGNTPTGFDCSGLVNYSFRPGRSAMSRATPARCASRARWCAQALCAAATCVFFDQEGKKSSHVGIYLGDGRLRPRAILGRQGPDRQTRRRVLEQAFRRSAADLGRLQLQALNRGDAEAQRRTGARRRVGQHVDGRVEHPFGVPLRLCVLCGYRFMQ